MLAVGALSIAGCRQARPTPPPIGQIPEVVTKAQPEWLPFAIRAGRSVNDDRREKHLAGLRRLTTNEDVTHVAWSPDSRRLVVESKSEGASKSRVATLDLGTGALVQASEVEVEASLPSFVGPAGDRLLFTEAKGSPAKRRVVSTKVDGSDLRELATEAADPVAFVDGSAVVFVRIMQNQNQLFIQGLSSPSEPVRLFSEPGRFDSAPAVSSDRTRVAWVSETKSNRGVLMSGRVPGRVAEGRASEMLSKEGESVRSPSFLPDSQHLAFASDHDDASFQIYLVDLERPFEGQRAAWIQLTFAEGGSESPAVSPDGRHLAFSSRRAGSGSPDAPRDLYVARWMEEPW